MNNLIPCTQKCKYQNDGYCMLDQIMNVSCQNFGNSEMRCIYYIPSYESTKNNPPDNFQQ